MTIKTTPIFYLIDAINGDNRILNFVEPNVPPGLELTATLAVGSRAMEQLMTEVARALNDSGQQNYTVTLDRNTRLVTISSDDTFELLVQTGSQVGSSPFSLLGFTGSDRTGASSYEGDTPIGSTYVPQFAPQSFLAFEDNNEGIQTSLNESASGVVEVVTFGARRLMEMELRFITDRPQGKGAYIQNNPNAVQEARDFLEFLITKSNLEFMKDINDRNTFDTVILERTQQARDGTSYRLQEQIDEGFADYFSTGLLTFRKIS